ncbi:hypothetical protein MRB53_034431 [Persea americana]|uniref:Uncharacterized protein n=1 Tax=Persea americana TaxID=3435 RepID=A0ACC2K233_PERAE|nr:hypothetical protein MRB53_034431 [Persea americana]
MELEPALLFLYLETQRKEMEPEQRIRSSRNLYESKCVGDSLFTHSDIWTNQDVLILEILAFPMSASSQEIVGRTTMNNRSKAHVYFSSGNVSTTMFGLMADCLHQ